MGLLGYGMGGRVFHAPYIDASPACELVAVATTSDLRRSQLRGDFPDVASVDSLRGLMDAGVDAVVISTPSSTRRDLVLEALGKGLHVVADKPFAPDAASARELVVAARSANVVLNVFHNRRYDPDIVTARKVITEGLVGTPCRLDLRCDQDGRDTLQPGPMGGVLRDLGSHIVDQALQLLGPAETVVAFLDTVDNELGETVSAFSLHLRHAGGAHSQLSSTKLAFLDDRELRLLGTAGSYVSNYSDVQAAAILRGERPRTTPRWGYEEPHRWGTLFTEKARRRIPSQQGDYTAFYDAFAEAVLQGTPGPVPSEQGLDVVRILDAAEQSATTGRVVAV